MTEVDWESLPQDGRWEVVGGRALLLPANDLEHQYVCDALMMSFGAKLKGLAFGHVVSAPNVRIPPRPGELAGIRSRVPDLAVAQRKPHRLFR